ncbi:MAG: DUF4097 family beta strand repeat protein [Clostridia bacterium]|nr:DUF4097 family beta strand repeat protein [Clostridia bacterium]
MKRITALLLTLIMMLSLFGCIRISCSAPIRYSNADRYTAGDFTYDESKVKKVEIEWIAGSVKLRNAKGTLSVSETCDKELSEELQMHWWIDGTTLKIKYCKSGEKLSLFDIDKKDLTVELPAFADLEIEIASGYVQAEHMLDLGKLKLETASGGADFQFLSAKEVKVDSASGGLNFGQVSVSGEFEINTASGGLAVNDITANEIDVNSASGDISLGKITAEKVDIDNASGFVVLWLHSANEVRIDSTSGGIRIKLDDKEGGAKIKFDAVSGNFNTALSVVNSGDLMTIGDGRINIEIKVVSGSVTVE